MAVEVEPAPVAEPTIQASMAKWLGGLKEALPNPVLGGANEPEPNLEPTEPAPGPAPTTPEVVPPVVPTPTPKPAAPEPAPQPEPISEERWPRSAKEWKNFTNARKVKDEEYQKQIAERDAKLKEYEAKAQQPVAPEVQKEIDTLKKENDEFSKQLRLLSVTNHPKFKSYFDNKVSHTLGQLKNCVSADQIESVTQLLAQPDSDHKNERINELLENMNALQQGRFLGVINSLSSIQAEKDAEIARAQQDYEQMVAAAKSEQDQRKTHFTKLLDDTIKVMQDAKNGRPEYQLRDGETEWNSSVQKRLDNGKQLITGNLPAEVMFKAAFDAAAYPDVLASYKTLLIKADKLEKQIAAMTATNPRVESPKRTDTNGTTNNETHFKKDARPMEYTKDWIKTFGKALQGETQ